MFSGYWTPTKQEAIVAVTQEKPAPYAPASAILDIVSRYRNRGLVFPVNADVLARVGISDSLIPRTLQALQVLDLFNKEGNPTDTLEGIRLAPEVEYKTRLADWLKAAYADVFSFVDPSKDGPERIRDAFRAYNPIGQQDRMVTLFTGLCAAAGLITEKPARAAPSSASQRGGIIERTMRSVSQKSLRQNPANPSPTLPPALAGLLASLPPNGQSWTAVRRKKFLTTFESVVDFCFPIDDKSHADKEE